MSDTATPMWSIRPNNMRRAGYRSVVLGVRRGNARSGDRRLMARHDRVDVRPLEHLALEEGCGERLERLAVGLQQLARAAHGEVGELLLLLVEDAARGVGDRVVVERHPA